MKIKYSINFFGVVAVLAYGTYMIIHIDEDAMDAIRKNEIDISFDGKVNEKFLDPEERHQPRIVLDDGIKYRIPNFIAYDSIKIGDRMVKHSGSLKYQIITNVDTYSFYPLYFDKEIR